MNISIFSGGANTQGGTTRSIFAGNLPMLQRFGTKSAQEKAERQQKTANEVAYWEERKESLKNTECETVEEIAQKLDLLQTYEDEISSAKQAYNREQMWHVLDEAKERGEKIAEAAEKMKPKTAEERLEEMAEEALQPEEEESFIEELTEEMEDLVEELAELEEIEELEEQMSGEEGVLREGLEDALEQNREEMSEDVEKLQEYSVYDRSEWEKQQEMLKLYKGLDIRI